MVYTVVLWQAVVNIEINVRSEIFMVLLLKTEVFCDMVPCHYVTVYQLTWHHVLEDFCFHANKLLGSVKGGKFIFCSSDNLFNRNVSHRINYSVAAELSLSELAPVSENCCVQFGVGIGQI
jgi:hypothetical protein